MDPINLEVGETSQLNFFSQQLREIENELQKHAAAREVLSGQAEKYMLTLRDKYGLNGQPMQFAPENGQLIVQEITDNDVAQEESR